MSSLTLFFIILLQTHVLLSISICFSFFFQILLYVIEKGKGRSSSKELCAYLKQPAQETQLKNQLYVVNVLSRTVMDDAKKHAFIKNPPAGMS